MPTSNKATQQGNKPTTTTTKGKAPQPAVTQPAVTQPPAVTQYLRTPTQQAAAAALQQNPSVQFATSQLKANHINAQTVLVANGKNPPKTVRQNTVPYIMHSLLQKAGTKGVAAGTLAQQFVMAYASVNGTQNVPARYTASYAAVVQHLNGHTVTHIGGHMQNALNHAWGYVKGQAYPSPTSKAAQQPNHAYAALAGNGQ